MLKSLSPAGSLCNNRDGRFQVDVDAEPKVERVSAADTLWKLFKVLSFKYIERVTVPASRERGAEGSHPENSLFSTLEK